MNADTLATTLAQFTSVPSATRGISLLKGNEQTTELRNIIETKRKENGEINGIKRLSRGVR